MDSVLWLVVATIIVHVLYYFFTGRTPFEYEKEK